MLCNLSWVTEVKEQAKGKWFHEPFNGHPLPGYATYTASVGCTSMVKNAQGNVT